MLKQSRVFAFGLVFLGLAGLCGVFVLVRPAWAQCNNLGCTGQGTTCDQGTSGSCPWCLDPVGGQTCTGQGITTWGSGEELPGSAPQTGSNVTWNPVVCQWGQYCTFVRNWTGSICFITCLDGSGTCQECKLGSKFSFSGANQCQSAPCVGGGGS